MLRASTEPIEDPDAVIEAIDGSVLAVVLVEPMEGRSSLDVVRSIRSHDVGAAVPVFVLVRTDSPRKVVALYKAGTNAVFEWPTESSIFPHVLTELLGIEVVRGHATRSDARLARAVRARLRATGGSAGGIRVRATKGFVMLSGEVPSLWEKDDVRRIVSLTPGVRGVRLDALHVKPSGAVSDRQLAKTVRDVIRAAIDSSDTLAASVDRGHVTLAGSVASRSEIQRITDLLSHVRGVCGVECLATISPRGQRQARTRTRELRNGLQRMFPTQRQVAVTAFGPAAVLSGRVSTLDHKKRIESFIEGHPSVDRMVSKLQVRSKP